MWRFFPIVLVHVCLTGFDKSASSLIRSEPLRRTPHAFTQCHRHTISVAQCTRTAWPRRRRGHHQSCPGRPTAPAQLNTRPSTITNTKTKPQPVLTCVYQFFCPWWPPQDCADGKHHYTQRQNHAQSLCQWQRFLKTTVPEVSAGHQSKR